MKRMFFALIAVLSLAFGLVGTASAAGRPGGDLHWAPPCVDGTVTHFVVDEDTGSVFEITTVRDCDAVPTLVSRNVVFRADYYWVGLARGGCIVPNYPGDTIVTLKLRAWGGGCVSLP